MIDFTVLVIEALKDDRRSVLSIGGDKSIDLLFGPKSTYITPEEAEEERKQLLKVFTPDEMKRYADEKDFEAQGRILKKSWANKIDQNKFKDILKVHWVKNDKVVDFINNKVSKRQELSAVMYESEREIYYPPMCWKPEEVVGIILDGWVTIAGSQDFYSYHTGIDKSKNRKYTRIPAYVETDFAKMKLKGEEQNWWNEALIANWHVKGFVVFESAPESVVSLLEETNLPIVKREYVSISGR